MASPRYFPGEFPLCDSSSAEANDYGVGQVLYDHTQSGHPLGWKVQEFLIPIG